jgi:hypothetical protein
VLWVAAWVVLTATVFLIPSPIWLAVRWALVAPVVALEATAGRSRRCGEAASSSRALDPGRLARRRQRGDRLLLGPLLGAILIFLTDCRSRCSTSSPGSSTRSRCRSSPS